MCETAAAAAILLNNYYYSSNDVMIEKEKLELQIRLMHMVWYMLSTH